ncbi:hypothetical protein L202_08263 [Cryptococcus amylolentus CBS 6039]|uniref:MAPEG family protein n=2 Tax=Cryptococcus amylolentus TaxID=104669 RepID=A0A1E3H929_9TREE|nr:hypothetical protein L202_08263 [Cryptococcus amylolentus CBS 6039]ODN72830.1 hypothetical protein L202_08263 [Cryptococcus amylolentus CBS 6039]ODN98023.1 hypothetical protein I350_07665 [Cryptococcus amylolentus CBS 6273]
MSSQLPFVSQAGLTQHNYSLYALPVGFLLAMGPFWYAVGLIRKHAGKKAFDLANPRESYKKLGEAKIDPKIYRRITRATAASDNTFSNLGYFSASVVAGNLAHLSARTLNTCVAVWIISRIAFALLYINTENPKNARYRSIVFTVGVLACTTLIIKAANKLSSVPW